MVNTYLAVAPFLDAPVALDLLKMDLLKMDLLTVPVQLLAEMLFASMTLVRIPRLEHLLALNEK